ncbi:MAG: hypothetical protein IJU19_04420 [Bacteroidales bacterium]|nr:hypothetical protein [Bacteroidales bacterium]
MSTGQIIILNVLAVLAAVALTGWIFYLLVKRWIDMKQKETLLQLKMEERGATLRVVTPLRLQAYERMALFLERMMPSSLVLRCYQPGMDLKQLQGVMTKSIRDEWEHNLSQQVYLSPELWMRIREAKDEMINLVNSSAVGLAEVNDPTRLAATVFASVADHSPADKALDAMHAELRELYG